MLDPGLQGEEEHFLIRLTIINTSITALDSTMIANFMVSYYIHIINSYCMLFMRFVYSPEYNIIIMISYNIIIKSVQNEKWQLQR